jgi:hypothetical protein
MPRPLARPIRTARDHKNASAIARKVIEQTEREPEAERRLQALLKEIDKFDGEVEEDDVFEDTPEDLEGLPRRRWSDEV